MKIPELTGLLETDVKNLLTMNGKEKTLFIADKLAWDQEDVPPFYNNVKKCAG